MLIEHAREGRPLIGDELLCGAEVMTTEHGQRIRLPELDDDGFQALAQRNDWIARAIRDEDGVPVIETSGLFGEAIERIASALTITLRNRRPPMPMESGSLRKRAISLVRALKQLRAEGWFDEIMSETLAALIEAEEIIAEGATQTAYMYGFLETTLLILEHEQNESYAEAIAEGVIEWASDALASLTARIVAPVIGDEAIDWRIDPDALREALQEMEEMKAS